MRRMIAILIKPIMRLTGFKFSKDYRYEISKFHSLVYKCIDTVHANKF